MRKNVLIIGCSSGIGYELLKIMLENDYKVYACSRTAKTNDNLSKLLDKYNNLYIDNIDVTNQNSIANTLKNANNKLEKIDLLVFNAGVYEVTSVDDFKVEDYEAMVNTNFLGAIRVTKEILLYFEKQGYGKCLYNASLSSYFGLPYAGGYGSSKAGLVSFLESIQPQMKLKNIDIQVVNHGFVKTRLTKKNDFVMPQLMMPKDTAKLIFEGMQKDSFEIRFPFKLSLFLRVLRVLPYKLSLYITKGLLK